MLLIFNKLLHYLALKIAAVKANADVVDPVFGIKSKSRQRGIASQP